MAIRITAAYNMAGIQKEIDRAVQVYKQQVLQAYQDAGAAWLERAKQKTKQEGGHGHITFNLVSSKGFVLLDNGREVAIEFEAVGNGEEGVKKGMDYARELAGAYSEGIVLICVAGMEYAAAVESKGFDVITGSSLYFEQELLELLHG